MIRGILGESPNIDDTSFVADSAEVIGKVTIEKNCSVWFGAVIRADSCEIHIGEGSNIQDNAVIHGDENCNAILGKNVTVGHGAIVHGCIIEDRVLIGMGVIILNGARVGKNTIIGAGSLITENKMIPEGVLCLGSPAKVVRELTKDEITSIEASAKHYIEKGKEFKKEL